MEEPKWLVQARESGLYVQTHHPDKGIVVITHRWPEFTFVYQVIRYRGEQILDLFFTTDYQEALDYYLV